MEELRNCILVGNVLERIKEIPECSIDCCVTSPPYFGLRDYGIQDVTIGSWAGSIGLETLHDCYGWTSGQMCDECYICHIRLIVSKIHRVLKPQGTFWLNIGDSYSGSGKGGNNPLYQKKHTQFGKIEKKPKLGKPQKPINELKPKDLIGIPFRLALALQADGWYFRSDIIWHKPNCTPEPVKDRPTSTYEHIFLFSKSNRYFYDHYSIMEISEDGYKKNKRNMWTVVKPSFRKEHYATFPEGIIADIISSGTPEIGVCAKCGAYPSYEVEKTDEILERKKKCGGDMFGDYTGKSTKDYKSAKAQDASEMKRRILAGMKHSKRTWTPGCNCDAGTQQTVVLDPFFGAGTTGLVAVKMNRSFVGIELSQKFVNIAYERINREFGLFVNVNVI